MTTRYRLVNRQRFLLFLAFCFMLLLLASMVVNAGAAISQEKSYDTVRVQNGDTLWEIASSYCTGDIRHYIFELKRINHLDHDTIQAGQILMLP